MNIGREDVFHSNRKKSTVGHVEHSVHHYSIHGNLLAEMAHRTY